MKHFQSLDFNPCLTGYAFSASATGFRILSIEHVDTEYFDIGQSYTGSCLYLEEV
jgi:hypothetical protein